MDYSKSFACHPRASQWSHKNKVKPNEVPLYYYKKYWFNCDVCKHEFETNLNSIARIGSWCPYCANKVLCSNTDCNDCFNKSFASSDKAKYWSTKNTTTPREYFKSCGKKFIFACYTCNEEFEATLNNITNGKWCKKCGYRSAKEKQSMTIEEFIKRSSEKFKETIYEYDYSKVVMDGVDNPITLICKVHLCEFQTTPYRHYTSDTGCCPVCTISTRAESRKYSFDEFLTMAKSIYRDTFDYSKSIDTYENMNKEIIIICKKHGEFEQLPSVHIKSKYGCYKCAKEIIASQQRLTTDEFIRRSKLIHNDKYDYSKTIYASGHAPVNIICKEHGIFEQNPYNHMCGFGCKRCTGIYCLEDFVNEATKVHNNIYDYSLVEYVRSITPVKIICKDCGVFEQTPNSHLGGAGCPICINKTEKKLYLMLKSAFPDVIKEYNPDWAKNETTGRNLRFDFFIPQINVIIELDGRQHFKQVRSWLSPEEQINRDVWKTKQANTNGIYVIRLVQEEVYKNKIEWLEENLLPELVKRDSNMFISSEEDIYDKHISLLSEC
jgi:very-short-patch-repair endonuclease/DNA-directed RNA polymerase subunit RPC12/RpoP